MKYKPIMYLFGAMLMAGSAVCAATPAPVTLRLENTTFDISKKQVGLQMTTDQPEAIMGASFTVVYDTAHLTLASVDTPFFKSFKEQFTQANALNTSLESVTIGDTTYTRPVVRNEVETAAGGSRISAIRVTPSTPDDTTLFTLNFTMDAPSFGKALPVTIVPSVIAATTAGYPEAGEEIPMLIGQTGAKEFPVLQVREITPGAITMVDHSKHTLSGTLTIGGKPIPETAITFHSPYTTATYTATTDAEGHFTVTVSDSAAAKPLTLRINSPVYGQFETSATATEDSIQIGFTNTAPEKPVLQVMPSAPVLLTPTISTQAFADANNDHAATSWQIVDLSRLKAAGLSTADILTQKGDLKESRRNYLAMEIHSKKHLTALPVPVCTLTAATKYAVRASFTDQCPADPKRSLWSDFTTFETQADPDGFTLVDGVLIPDGQRLSKEETSVFTGNVTGLRSADASIDMGFSRPEGGTFRQLASIPLSDLDKTAIEAMPEDLEMPYGLVAFHLDLPKKAPSDKAVSVTIQFDISVPETMTWWKHNIAENTWMDYSEHARFNADRTAVTLDLKDGDYGDFDGIRNGRILDPGGIALLPAAPPHGGGGHGSCYIDTIGADAPICDRLLFRSCLVGFALLFPAGLAVYRRNRRIRGHNESI